MYSKYKNLNNKRKATTKSKVQINSTVSIFEHGSDEVMKTKMIEKWIGEHQEGTRTNSSKDGKKGKTVTIDGEGNREWNGKGRKREGNGKKMRFISLRRGVGNRKWRKRKEGGSRLLWLMMMMMMMMMMMRTREEDEEDEDDEKKEEEE
jgi:hypothetical protein